MQIQRKAIQEQGEFSDLAYLSLITLLDEFKRRSATRTASLSGIYSVTDDRPIAQVLLPQFDGRDDSAFEAQHGNLGHAENAVRGIPAR